MTQPILVQLLYWAIIVIFDVAFVIACGSDSMRIFEHRSPSLANPYANRDALMHLVHAAIHAVGDGCGLLGVQGGTDVDHHNGVAETACANSICDHHDKLLCSNPCNIPASHSLHRNLHDLKDIPMPMLACCTMQFP